MQGDRNEIEWMELKQGDAVLVSGIKGQFIFENVRMEGDTPLWVTVARAKTDRRMGTRMITPDRIGVAKGRGIRMLMI